MSRQHPGALTTKQQQAISALLTCPNVRVAAKVASVSEKTMWNWLATPAFKAAYEEQARAGADLVKSQIESLSEKAIQALIESLDSPSHLAKIAAIKIVIDRLLPEPVKAIQTTEDAGPAGPIPAELLPFVSEEDLGLIDAILARAQQARKAAAEMAKVTQA